MLPAIPAADFAQFIKALKYSSRKHSDQRRKDANASPYINHPIEVVEVLWSGGVQDMTLLVGALLHDTLEDTETTPQELDREFGSDVLALVQEVSDDKSLPKQVRKNLQIEHAPHKSIRAKQLKIADLICNIRSLVESPPKDWPPSRKIGYLDWAGMVFEGLRGVNPALEQDFAAAIEEARRFFSDPSAV